MENDTQKEVICAKVTQEDIDKAMAEIGTPNFSYVCGCVVYQVAERMGLKPMCIFPRQVNTSIGEQYILDNNGYKITSMHHLEWQNSLNIEFTFTKKSYY